MLKREITITFASNVFATIVGIGSSVILARVLGPANRGLLGLALLIPMVLSTFCILGQNTVNLTFAGLYKNKHIQLFQQSLLFGIFVAVISFLIIYAFFFWLPTPRTIRDHSSFS